MNNAQTKPVFDYVFPDKVEIKLKNIRDMHTNGSSDYNNADEKYKKKMMLNRGISKKEQEIIFDADKFGKYFYEKRIYAILIFGVIHLFNIREGTYDPVDKRFILKCMKVVLEEYPRKVWSLGRQNTYLEAFNLCLEQVDALDPDANTILMENGILRIDDYCKGKRQLDSFTPDEIHLNKIKHIYDPSATCKLFVNTLNDIFNNDLDMVLSFQEMLGSFLYYGSQCKVQKIFVFFGCGSNGKTLLCSVIRQMLGEKNCSSSYLESIQERFGYQDMYGKMVNISPETEKNKILQTAALKALTGGDAITYEFKYKTAFTSRNYTKLVVCTNHELMLEDDTVAISRRIHGFHFMNSYRALRVGELRSENVKEADPNLEEKLVAEIPGIINFALEGLCRLIKNNWKFTQSDKIAAYADGYKAKPNEIEAFTEHCLVFKEGVRIRSSEVYTRYKNWCKDELNKDVTYKNTEFHNKLKTYLNSKDIIWTTNEIRGYVYYKGLTSAE